MKSLGDWGWALNRTHKMGFNLDKYGSDRSKIPLISAHGEYWIEWEYVNVKKCQFIF